MSPNSRTIIAKNGTYAKGNFVLLDKVYWIVRSWTTLGDVSEYLCEATGEAAKGESDAVPPMSTMSLYEEIKKLQLICQGMSEVLTDLVIDRGRSEIVSKERFEELHFHLTEKLAPAGPWWKRFWLRMSARCFGRDGL